MARSEKCDDDVAVRWFHLIMSIVAYGRW